jgi:hypothetical protein
MPSRRYIPSQATLLPAHSLSTLRNENSNLTATGWFDTFSIYW